MSSPTPPSYRIAFFTLELFLYIIILKLQKQRRIPKPSERFAMLGSNLIAATRSSLTSRLSRKIPKKINPNHNATLIDAWLIQFLPTISTTLLGAGCYFLLQWCHFLLQWCHFLLQRCHFLLQWCHFLLQWCHFLLHRCRFLLQGLQFDRAAAPVPDDLHLADDRCYVCRAQPLLRSTHPHPRHRGHGAVLPPSGPLRQLVPPLPVKRSCESGGDCNGGPLPRAPRILSRITKIDGTRIRLGYLDVTFGGQFLRYSVTSNSSVMIIIMETVCT